VSSCCLTTEDGCSLAYEDIGSGLPTIWQHGLGADRQQPAEVFPRIVGVRRITLECRGHGQSQMGDPALLSIAQFATDVAALLDHLGIDAAVLGGISLGAAISMRLAAGIPRRIKGLILARPAWVDAPAPHTMKPYLVLAELLKEYGREEGLKRFANSETLAVVERVSPDNAASLLSFFTRPDEQSTIELLSRIPKDGPGLSRQDMASIAMPTLIIGSGKDYVHPLRYASQLKDLIPGAALQIITSKTVDKALYQSQFRESLAAFLQRLTAAG
jgi:pimeloyl-ACP methyl ester carboxylesterase